jgi:hypothetical protein
MMVSLTKGKRAVEIAVQNNSCQFRAKGMSAEPTGSGSGTALLNSHA